MPGLKIPPEQLPALKKIAALSRNSMAALATGLEMSPEGIPSVPDVSPDDIERIKSTLVELYSVRSYFDVEVPQFVDDLAEAFQESSALEDIEGFKERLTKLLAIESMGIDAKALLLKAEYEHTFCTARILTDARPIYGTNLSQIPPAVMIIHTLRISYHDESSRLREIYIAMDADDIRAVREVLDRAEIKSKSLESVFAAAKVRVVD